MKRETFALGSIAALGALGAVRDGGRASVDPPYGRVLERYFRAGHFDGIALVARGDRALYRGAAGLANREARIPHAFGETFRIASVTKQFTALLVMQEVRRGTIALDAPLVRYLPEVAPDVAPVTMRQLLTNTSGLVNLDTIPNAYTRTDFTPDDLPAYVRSLPIAPLVSAPGTKFSYNNLDFIVAGAVLQRVCGKSFEMLFKERIATKLGLTNTGLYGSAIPPAYVRGYEDANGRLVPEKIGRIANFGPAGAMYSTLDDLLRWDRALMTNAILDAPGTAEMFAADRAFGYVALGSWAYDLPIAGTADRVHLIERQGNIGGVQILNLFAPADDIALIVAANTDYADLFNTYSRKGLPYELISLAVLQARASSAKWPL